MSTNGNGETEIITAMQNYISEKEVSPEASAILAKISFAFSKQIAYELNELLKSQDVQTADLKASLEAHELNDLSDKVTEHLTEVLKERKKRVFEALRQTDFVSKNYHFEFARQLLASKHRESAFGPANEYSDDDDE